MSIQEAKRVLRIEADAIADKIDSLDENFENAVNLILQCQGKLVVTGMGKSGQIGQKISSTFSSTGTPSLFLSPAEGSHGDLGVIAKGDVVIGISNGGESVEMEPLLKYVSRKGIPLIAMTGKSESTLGKLGNAVINIGIKEEACPLGLAPTTSSTVTLALGDALAMAVLKERGFKQEDFAEFHPGGSLGRRLLTKVSDVMHTGEALPIVLETELMSKVVSSMTNKNVQGVTGVVDADGALIGVVTDGDIRRFLENGDTKWLNQPASECLSLNPKTIDRSELAQKALFVMEQFAIQTLFVIDKTSSTPTSPVGLIHFQDLLKAGIK